MILKNVILQTPFFIFRYLKTPARTSLYKKTRAIVNPDFSKVENRYVLISLQLQRVFGLRREES